MERADREAQAQAEAAPEAASASTGAAAPAAKVDAVTDNKARKTTAANVIEVTNVNLATGKASSGEADVVGKGQVQQGDIGAASHSALHYISIAASLAVAVGIALYGGW